MKYRIVADSSSNILSMDNPHYFSVPMKVRAEKEYIDDAQLDVAQMVEDLKHQFLSRKLFIDNDDMTEMANFYATLCVYYFGGRMYEITDWIETEEAYKMWTAIDYASDLSSFLKNILEDEAKDFAHLTIPY